MAVFSAIAGALGAIGTAASVVGTAASIAGGFQQAAGQRKAQNAQKRGEILRMKAAELDQQRQVRETVRQQQIARAQALTNTTAAGASGSGSSALAGAEGTIAGQANRNIQELNSNLEMGRFIFGTQMDTARGNAMAARGGTLANAGAGFASLGNQLVKNQKEIVRIGGFGRA